MILEPCCYKTQLSNLLNSKSITEHLFTYGDTDLQMLMDFFVYHAHECEVYLTLVQVEPETLYTITKLMEAKNNATGNPLIKSFVLLHQGHNRKFVHEALDKYRQEGRLLICEAEASFRCLCVGNGKKHFVLQGALPQTKNFAMQMFSLTMGADHYDKVMHILNYQKRKNQG